MPKRTVRGDLLRRALADEAARIMIEHGVGDYGFAKRKAAERMGVLDHAVLPKNTETEAALADRQRLFAPELQADGIAGMRRAAVEAMALLREFEPRLVGPVLAGDVLDLYDAGVVVDVGVVDLDGGLVEFGVVGFRDEFQ